VARLILCVITLWLFLAYPARHWAGELGLVYISVSAILCVIPSIVMLGFAAWSANPSPERQLAIVLGGTLVRMTFVMAAALTLYLAAAAFSSAWFWMAVAVFYLFTLAVETFLMVRMQPTPERNG
jgi:small-conductance mechanosensitive channel